MTERASPLLDRGAIGSLNACAWRIPKFARILCRNRDLDRIRRCATWPSCSCNLLTTVARLAPPGGARALVAESVLVKHQLLILNRSRKRSPNLRTADRVIADLCAIFMRPGRLIRSAIVFKPRTLLKLHQALIQRKYRLCLLKSQSERVGRFDSALSGPDLLDCEGTLQGDCTPQR